MKRRTHRLGAMRLRSSMLCLLAAVGATGFAFRPVAGGAPDATPAFCSVSELVPSAYYRIDLVSTRRVPGTRYSRGVGDVTFTSSSPFGIALAADGSYSYDVRLSFERLPDPRDGIYAIWLTTTQLDKVVPAGVLAPDQRTLAAKVDWNQFLVVVSLESDAASVGDRWSGPIVMRGISKSGLMHTMAGHGPFEEENCAAYGYD